MKTDGLLTRLITASQAYQPASVTVRIERESRIIELTLREYEISVMLGDDPWFTATVANDVTVKEFTNLIEESLSAEPCGT